MGVPHLLRSWRSCRVTQLADERSRRVLELGALGGGHLASPDVEPIGVRRAGQVGVDGRALVAVDQWPACMQTGLQAIEPGRAPLATGDLLQLGRVTARFRA